jgi:MFS family permease
VTGIQVDLVQQRTVRTLMVSQAFGAVGLTIGIATASLLAEDVSGSEKMAGLAQTFQVLGAAAASWLLARMMAKRGRRLGLATGNLVGAAGALLCVVSGVQRSMPLMFLGFALLGSMSAANLASRYAATDLAAPEHRARALAVVVWATTIGAVVGPNLTGPSAALADLLDIPRLAGPFALGTGAMVISALVLLVFLRPDPLLLARERAQVEPPGGTSWGRVGIVLRERPVVVAAITGLAAAHAVMVSVMVMTPLHMHHGGAHLHVIGYVISVHVLGMFAFAPLVGWGADQLGRAPVLGMGGGTLLVALLLCGVSPEGSSWQIFVGLFLLGVGWSFSTVAASTMISDHAPLDVRTDVQGAADLVMQLTAGAAGGLAGLIVGGLGYGWLNAFSAVLASAVLAAALLGAGPRSSHPSAVLTDS